MVTFGNAILYILLSSDFHRPVGFAVHLPRCLSGALVVILLASAQAKLYLYVAPLEIEGQRHQGQPVLFDPVMELYYLLLMHQEPSGPERILVENVSLGIGTDMHPVYHELAVIHPAVAVL